MSKMAKPIKAPQASSRPRDATSGREGRARPTFTEAFGAIKAESEEAQSVLNAKPTGAIAERESARAELGRRMDVLTKKDELTEKVCSLLSLSCRWLLRACDGAPLLISPGGARACCTAPARYIQEG